MGLADQLTFYDLVGLIIPGGAIVAPVAWSLLSLDLASWPALDPLSLAAAALGGAYVVGHLAHLATRIKPIDSYIKQRGPGHPYEETLLDPETARQAGHGGTLSPTFFARLEWSMERGLGFEPDLTTPAGRREAFGLCYAHVVQHGNVGRIQLFKGLSAFYRGMVPAAVVTVAVGVATAAVLVAQLGPTATGATALWAAAGLAVLGLAGVALFMDGFHKMDERFVVAVLRSYYVLACPPADAPEDLDARAAAATRLRADTGQQR